jgi:hypothetical protein
MAPALPRRAPWPGVSQLARAGLGWARTRPARGRLAAGSVRRPGRPQPIPLRPGPGLGWARPAVTPAAAWPGCPGRAGEPPTGTGWVSGQGQAGRAPDLAGSAPLTALRGALPSHRPASAVRPGRPRPAHVSPRLAYVPPRPALGPPRLARAPETHLATGAGPAPAEREPDGVPPVRVPPAGHRELSLAAGAMAGRALNRQAPWPPVAWLEPRLSLAPGRWPGRARHGKLASPLPPAVRRWREPVPRLVVRPGLVPAPGVASFPGCPGPPAVAP